MKTAAISLIAVAVASCTSGDSSAPTAAAAPQVPSVAAAANKWDLTPAESAGCAEYAKFAGYLAADRDDGVPLAQQLMAIRQKFSGTAAKEFIDLATAVYQDPAFNKQTSESEAKSWLFDCDTRIGKTKAGAKYSNSPAEIAAALADFKTFDGTPLVELLGKYGIKISYVEAVPAEFFAPLPYEKGELVYSMNYGTRAARRMPCDLKDEFKGPILPTTEFIRRVNAFPFVRPEEDDPLIYWAATGKCQS